RASRIASAAHLCRATAGGRGGGRPPAAAGDQVTLKVIFIPSAAWGTHSKRYVPFFDSVTLTGAWWATAAPLETFLKPDGLVLVTTLCTPDFQVNTTTSPTC